MRLWLVCALALASSCFAHSRPERVVLIVIDQMRADLPDKFPMPNVRRLMREGTSFPDAIVGHLASETVVSHLVMTSGRWPRSLPWGDEVLADARGTLGAKGRLYLTTALSVGEMRKMLAAYPGPAGMPALFGEPDTAWSIGAKTYATHAMAATGAGHVIVLSAPREKWEGRRGPEGEGLPLWLQTSDRFRVDGAKTYGTERLEYQVKGDQYVRGEDPAHEGGDLWVADLGVEVMKREPSWRTLMLTMGGVDKVGHMLGDYDRKVDLGQDAALSLARAAADADAAVGRVLDGLERTGVADRTLVVLTADHGGLDGRWVGDQGPNRANDNWYAGVTENGRFDKPSRAVAPLIGTRGVQFVMADSSIRVWMSDHSDAALIAAAQVARTRPGAREVWVRRGLKWSLMHRNGPPAPAGSFHARRVPELLASVAAEHAPDLLVLLEDGVTYGARGDHGGAQELAQRIPLIFRGAGAPRGETQAGGRLVDIAPTLSHLLGRDQSGYDGRALLK